MADATNTTLGEIKLAGDLAGSNNALLPELTATAVTPGAYTIPNITVDSKGRITAAADNTGASIASIIPNATTTSKGLVQIGTGLTVAAGVVSIDTASVPLLSTQNTFTKSQVVAISTLTSSASITPDFSLSNVFYVDLAHNFTLNNPTNVVAGGTYHIIIKQDATGSRVITWGSAYKFRGFAPEPSTVANRTDIVSVVAISSSFLVTELQKGYA